ncbi:TOX high mobility group box family member 4-A, putative isoform 4 [Quillaja saponaria]|uniref:TOX high mobility group box family member 4-A, putative isoform 4 n=1 Tax=Quillaja saponaria TaxID=32244 RepID=A0AAD7KXN3_QUISA|nr:TOX high mobility group box family member 4-A, putative isoform 4 [Quillaja saponaria]
MDELGSIWRYEESVEDLKQQLYQTVMELESVRMEADEEKKKSKEKFAELIKFLGVAMHERDDAKNQLDKLLKCIPSSPTDMPNILPQFQPQTPLLLTAKANSSITESNSLSEAYNHQSHNSSPVDSFIEAASSPDFSNFNTAVDSANMGYVNQPLAQDYNCSLNPTLVSSAMPKFDPADALIDELAGGKPLPQKGNLLQSVTEAGPLLQSLLVAGLLPQWKNPPPLQSFRVPPLAIQGYDNANTGQTQRPVPLAIQGYDNANTGQTQIPFPSANQGYNNASINQRVVANTNYLLTKPLNSIPPHGMSGNTNQTCPSPMLNFTNSPSGSYLSNALPLPSATVNNQVRAGKRRRVR